MTKFLVILVPRSARISTINTLFWIRPKSALEMMYMHYYILCDWSVNKNNVISSNTSLFYVSKAMN